MAIRALYPTPSPQTRLPRAASTIISVQIAGVTHEGAATLAGVGTATAVAQVVRNAQTTVDGIGTLTSVAQVEANASAALVSLGEMQVTASGSLYGVITMGGSGTFSANGQVVRHGSAILVGNSKFRDILLGYSAMHSYAWLVSQGTVPAPVIHNGIAAISAHGILTAAGRRANNEVTAVGVGNLYPVGTVIKPINRQARRVAHGRSGVRGSVVRSVR